MATYKGTKGFTIQTIAGDPPAPIEGQVWYNTTSNVLKGYALGAGVWSSGSNLNTARNAVQNSGGGTQTAGLCFGGNPPGVSSEEYDGTSWSAGNPLLSAKAYLGGAGIQTSAMAMEGEVETYDGTSWTESTALNTPRGECAGAGSTNTATLCFGGGPSGSLKAVTEKWNGSTWTETGNLNTARRQLTGGGTNTAALAFTGGPPPSNATESWDGASWSNMNNLNTPRYSVGSSQGSSNTLALAFGGGNAVTGVTEKWDGTSWTEVADLATARNELGGNGSSTVALAFGGSIPPATAATEEWNDPAPPAVTVTFTSS